jgi:hypothetical protein
MAPLIFRIPALRQRGESAPPLGKVLETQESPAITPRISPSRLGETRPSTSYCEEKALLMESLLYGQTSEELKAGVAGYEVD